MALLTEEQQSVAVRALATTLGKPISEIETTLAGDSPGDVDALVSQRIKAIRKEGEDIGHGKVQKFANKKVKELFGIDSGVDTMDELLMAIKEGFTPELDPGKLTEEQVKMHPSFRQLETSLQTKEAEFQKSLDQARAEARAEVDLANLKARAVQARTEFGAVIPEDPKIAAAMERIYMEQLSGVTTKAVDGKTEYWKDGKRIENDKLFPVSEQDFFKGLVENAYTTKVSEQKTGTGIKPGEGQQQAAGGFKHFKGTVPKTQEEYDAIVTDRTAYSVDERQEIVTFWNSQK